MHWFYISCNSIPEPGTNNHEEILTFPLLALPGTDGRPVRQVLVTVMDGQGNRVALADNEVSCFVRGGRLMGMENASPDASDNFLDNRQRCNEGRLLIFIRKDSTENPESLRLSAPMLESLTPEF